jgi:hypothetical protein
VPYGKHICRCCRTSTPPCASPPVNFSQGLGKDAPVAAYLHHLQSTESLWQALALPSAQVSIFFYDTFPCFMLLNESSWWARLVLYRKHACYLKVLACLSYPPQRLSPFRHSFGNSTTTLNLLAHILDQKVVSDFLAIPGEVCSKFVPSTVGVSQLIYIRNIVPAYSHLTTSWGVTGRTDIS